ncbi:hypothetical protein PPTG_24880 [Phytophthora nicotianae INRA-310]|uniref:Amino acid transporter n=1 Tax=Phytophthora nicotianae (strain INRA-310) TaxID=761204 RepID=W2P9Z1_PHYN3|nr:hypothetical protein PPTG_24880 [Phytophthora nicotianae INRA-310]ETM97651.1 hypothetical protein PPTG_24880 [Phytophthora nicotianae INRA-310]
MESLPSSPASTVPSVLESNEVEERQSRNDGNSNASYGEEQFESESEHPASDSLNSSSSGNYASDEFEVDEHDQEAVGTIERKALGGGVDDDQVYSEDNEYADESFEDEREDVTGFDNQTETHDVERQQDAKNQELDIDEVVQLMPTVGQDLDPHVGTWCSKKIRELRVASSQSETRRSRRRNTRSNVDRIPTAVVENLIHRANNARPSGRAHEKPGNSWLRYHQQLKVPASLMQRVQTRLWMAKTSYTESTKESTPESLSTSLRSVAATFCSVKRDDLLGQLATMKLSKKLTSILALNDTSSNFATATATYTDINVSQQLFAILNEIIPSNMVKAFSSSSTMGVITLAIFFGIAVVMSHERTRRQLALGGGPAGTTKTDIDINHLLLLINHGGLVCQLMINSVVSLIPFAIVSMIAGSMAQYTSSMDLVESVGFLIVALALALITLTYGIMGMALFVTTRVNVFTYLRHIIPAQVFIFGCSSSIATLPMTMRCVDSTREVSYALSRFLLPLGATSNLNGSACYMTLACVFMAKVGGYGDLLTPLRYVLLVLVGAIASFGVAPVPHSGLVMAITVWHTAFNMDVPPVFSLLVGADWLLNRMRAIVNITNDTILVRIIADQCDETTITELELEAQPTHLT